MKFDSSPFHFHRYQYQVEVAVSTVEEEEEGGVEGDLQSVLSVGVQEVEVEVAKVVEAMTWWSLLLQV